MRGLSPMGRGLAEVIVALCGVALLVWPWMRAVTGDLSPELLRSLAEVNAALLIAYAVEVSWIARAARRRPRVDREHRLGGFVGIGAGGLFAVLLALLLAERALDGHWGSVEELGFSLTVAALAALGAAVVLQPLVFHEWSDEARCASSPEPDE